MRGRSVRPADRTAPAVATPTIGRPENPVAQGPGLSADFRHWLKANGYAACDFGRDRLAGGSFGGRSFANEPIEHTPVVFVHGSGDRASLGWMFEGFDRLPAPLGFFNLGWSTSVQAFKKNGYKNAELYATTWGPGDCLNAQFHGFDKAAVMHQRKFIEAVLDYTDAKKIHIIAHSAGVPLARRAIAGCWAVDQSGERYFVGPPLDDRVDTFLGICGANRGVPSGALFPWLPIFNPRTGYYPGMLGASGPLGMSEFLRDLESEAKKCGDFVVSIWSGVDELLAPGIVWGEPTSRIPKQDGEVVFMTPPYSHILTRELTGALQYELVTKHACSASNAPLASIEGIPKVPP
jgi:hypothetical protein